MNPKVDWFFEKAGQWQEEYSQLRNLVLACGPNEELKWGCPCYTINGKNVVLIHGFKEYCALLFMKGALMHNDHGLLIQQTENVQAARQMRFTSLVEIKEQADVIKACIFEAIELEKAGKVVPLKKATEFPMAEEFQLELDNNPAFKMAFEALTPGRQRAYKLHFSQPKQAKTRADRVAKCLPMIMDGKGLNDL